VVKNDEGEFELILGNRQLLGVFFIVIVLLAVFFTMGYIVGRNSAPLITAEAPARKADGKPLVVDSPVPKQESAPDAAEPAAKPVETPAPSAKPAPPNKKEKPPEKEPPVTKKQEPAKAEKAPPPAVSGAQPEPGKTYLQLVATAKTDADAMVDLLRKNGFTAFNYQIPENPSRYRVMVGPIADGDVNKMKADLQAKSFPGDRAIRKAF
jgi:hypothetical protein